MPFQMALINDIQYKMHMTLIKISISDFFLNYFLLFESRYPLVLFDFWLCFIFPYHYW